MKKELTIKEIKKKQKELEMRIKNLLNEFYEETEVKARGEINFGFTDNKDQHWIYLKYDNPFA